MFHCSHGYAGARILDNIRGAFRHFDFHALSLYFVAQMFVYPGTALFMSRVLGLASNSIRPVGAATWFAVAANIIIHPALAFALADLVTLASECSAILLRVAAGPCGAIPFAIAFQYGIKTETIAKAVLFSTLFSLLRSSALTA